MERFTLRAIFSASTLCQTEKMNRLLKTLLLWILIVALPLQATAAVAKASCGPRHHTVSSVASTTAGEHLHDHGDAGSAPHHHHAADTHAVTDHQSGGADLTNIAHDTSTQASSAEQIKTSYCSACAACCAGAVAPPSGEIRVALPNTFVAAMTPPAVSFTGIVPSALERPPRQLSA